MLSAIVFQLSFVVSLPCTVDFSVVHIANQELGDKVHEVDLNRIRTIGCVEIQDRSSEAICGL